MNQLYMGFAERNITPDRPMETIGFAPQMSEGVRAPLTAQVSVWSQNGMGCCLAAIDHIGFSRPMRMSCGRASAGVWVPAGAGDALLFSYACRTQ